MVEKDEKKNNDNSRVVGNTQENQYASFGQKLGLVIVLIILTAVLIILWFFVYKNVESTIQPNTFVNWNMPSGFELNPGPSSFWYDDNSKSLNYLGIIDDKEKEKLISLIKNINDDTELKKEIIIYSKAIDELAYKSNSTSKNYIYFLLLLGGLSGMLGVQLRSLSNFIGVACFKNKLDVSRWWPWYYLRPVTGFVLGLISVLIIESKLIFSEGMSPTGISWWPSIAFLAGFGASEFTDRLRLLTLTIFGEASKKQQNSSSNNNDNKPEGN